MSTFGERLKFLRKLHGKTQAELGEIIGLSKTSVHNYEADISIPGTLKIVELARYFNVDVDYLIGNSDCMYDDASAYMAHKKLPLLHCGDVINMPKYIETAAYDYIDAPADGDFAVKLCKNNAEITVVAIKKKTKSLYYLCSVSGRLELISHEKAALLAAPDRIICSAVCFL